MKNLLILYVLIFTFGCSQQVKEISKVNDILDGIYHVVEEYDNVSIPQLNSDSLTAIKYSDLFDEDDKRILVLNNIDFVPLSLKRNPIVEEQKDDKKKLFLELTNDASIKLKAFTEKHLNEKVAIVIGNKAMTVYKVMMAIDGGKLQITRCTDRTCEILFMELKDNVVGMPK